MFFEQAGVFILGLLSMSLLVLGRPLQPETPVKQRHVVRARVVARDASPSLPTITPPARTVIVSGTLTATPVAGAITVQFGFFAPTLSSSSTTTIPIVTESPGTPLESASASATSATPAAPSTSAQTVVSSASSNPAVTVPTATTTSATTHETDPTSASTTPPPPPPPPPSPPPSPPPPITDLSTGTPTISISAVGSSGTSTAHNLQVFTGNLGGTNAPPVYASGNQFQVIGNSLFNKKTDALSRSCSIQMNDCADAANASGNKGDFTVSACNSQQNRCLSANGT